MIVVAGLIGSTQWRLPRAVKDYHDRVTVEESALGLHDTIASYPWNALRHAMRLADGHAYAH
jgi:hypothetical protein